MTCEPGETYEVPPLCDLCKQDVPTEPVNVGDDVSARLMHVCAECNRTKLLPPDY